MLPLNCHLRLCGFEMGNRPFSAKLCALGGNMFKMTRKTMGVHCVRKSGKNSVFSLQ